jgi:DNA repair exonuclease SbcCD ATPase subunit
MEFPSLKKVELRSFSLYRNRPELSLDLDYPVFCLAGANGLGKSTFLNAVTYGLTGVIANPADKFDSIEEHYSHNLSYASDYFEGRIDEADRQAAEISLSFTVGPHRYEITRGMFEPQELRALRVSGESGDIISGDDLGDTARHKAYAEQLAGDIGLANFEQYVFLQHFVFTFDERRRLLFWHPNLVEQALYLAFDIPGDEAQKADGWRREADRFDSQARNLQYQATTARNRLKEIKREAEGTEAVDDDLVRDHEDLIAERKTAAETLQRVTITLDDSMLELQRALAEELTARGQYEEAFSAHLDLFHTPSQHPLIRSTLADSRCAICGTADPAVEKTVSTRLGAGKCPLCDSEIDESSPTEKAALKAADSLGKELEKREGVSSEHRASVRRLEQEVAAAQAGAERAAAALAEFEAKNAELRDLAAPPGSALDELVKRLEAEIEDATARRTDFRARRDEKRKLLREVQKKLAANYREVEADFLPLFTELAQSFIGLELELQLDIRKSTDVELAISVEGSRRREIEQLSESQRYFLDIALRMALTRQMVGSEGSATLFIDTPEGSLDVAYESRAGTMFASYVDPPRRIVMTANLNASRLLRELAHECGRERMRVGRMLDWADLSDVQAASEALFEDAYEEIEAELSGAEPE